MTSVDEFSKIFCSILRGGRKLRTSMIIDSAKKVAMKIMANRYAGFGEDTSG